MASDVSEVKPVPEVKLRSGRTQPSTAEPLVGQKPRQASIWSAKPDQFSGGRAISRGIIYRRPTRDYLEKDFYGKRLEEAGIDETEYRHKDMYGRITYRKRDVVRYISPTESIPKHLIVQATPYAVANQPAGDWRRVTLKGQVPATLRLSEWALAPNQKYKKQNYHGWGWLLMCLRVPIVAAPLLVLLSLPIQQAWADSEFQDSYTEFPNYYWDYPKYARNKLDMAPSSTEAASSDARTNSKSLSNKLRLLRPRLLVVLTDDRWKLDPSPKNHLPYIFISYTWTQWNSYNDETKMIIEEIAQAKAIEAGLRAYWCDIQCLAPDGEEYQDLRNGDVYRMCDVIRGAQGVCVVLPDLSLETKQKWGSRMWTLPEALLSSKQEIKFCSPKETQVMSKLEITDEVWNDGDPADGDNQPTRLLAEHYSGVLNLGRLELFATALEALSNKERSNFTVADRAYALMGLLHNRIQINKGEGLFLALARLSLVNDSDRLVERMVCMFPNPEADKENLFLSLVKPDQFDTQLWDIEPLCQIAGVGDDGQVILDNCRGVSIRWKAFPQMRYKRSASFRRWFAEMVIRSGAYLATLGLALVAKYSYDLVYGPSADPNNDSYQLTKDIALIAFGTLLVFLALLIALAAPLAVRTVVGGRVTESAPWLVGLEGVLPIAELERTIFGNCIDRLSYEPSSTPYCEREPDERLGKEPRWIAKCLNKEKTKEDQPPALPARHRFFTLVDTGALTVSVFSAVRPPSVALICGREGGMLRTVLCHYEMSNNCLYRETVMRMESMTLNQAKVLSWVKVSLGSNMP